MKLSATIMDAYEGSDGDIGRRSGDGVEMEWKANKAQVIKCTF